MKNMLLVGFGGALGSIGRYLISFIYLKYQSVNSSFPYPTFIVNILGCILIGALMASILKSNHSNTESYKLLLVTGFCGGFTTFSALSYESIQLIQNNQYTTALLYIGLSIILGLGFTFLTFALVKG